MKRLLLALHSPAVAASGTGQGHAYIYDAHQRSSPTTHVVAGDGPPAGYSYTTYGTVDRRSHGGSAGLDAARPVVFYTYDNPAPLVQVAGAVGTLQEQARVADSRAVVFELSRVAAKTVPGIKVGSQGGESAGKVFPQSVRKGALDENPSTCVCCRMETDRPQVDHAIPGSRGGNATLDNAQNTWGWCNASKGARDFPVNPPPGFEGMWPPLWWMP